MKDRHLQPATLRRHQYRSVTVQDNPPQWSSCSWRCYYGMFVPLLDVWWCCRVRDLVASSISSFFWAARHGGMRSFAMWYADMSQRRRKHRWKTCHDAREIISLVSSYPLTSTLSYSVFFCWREGPPSAMKPAVSEDLFKLCFPSFSPFGLRLSTAAKSSSNAS